MADPVAPGGEPVTPRPEPPAPRPHRPRASRPSPILSIAGGGGSDLRRRVVLGVVAAAAALLVVFLALLLYAFTTLPDPSKLDLSAGTIAFTDRHGAVIEELNGQGAPITPVKLDQISPSLRQATLAAEDRHFYEHHGVDWPRVVKAFVVDVVARRPEQGASTIEEQLAKVAILNSPKRSGLTKLRELLLAVAMDQRYNKNQILELYLNTIYYGHHATGIEAAAQVYFNAHANDLDLAQSAMLAGLPNGPALYDPVVSPDLAKARQTYVLDGMVKTGAISAAQASQARAEALHYSMKEQRSTLAPHFVNYVMQELESQYGPNAVAHGEFVVKTTLDLTLQRAAQHAVDAGVKALGPLGADNGDLLAVDPRTGEILAMVGSANFYDDNIHGQYNVVTGERQPGSSFKPYVYLTAFREHHLTMGSMLDDTSSHFANGRFHDFDNQDMGWITAHAALLLSRNVPALETMQKAGVQNVIDVAHSFGIHSTLKPEVGTAIGSSSIRMLDQVTGYGVFASGGWLHPPVSVLSITDRSGNSLGQPNAPQAQQVASAQETYLITYILKDYARQWDLGWNKPFAGKSGTTNDFHDAWMMAYAPNLVIGAWMGHTGPGNQDMDGVYGSMVGSTVLKDFINNGLTRANYPVESFTRPSGLSEGGACAGPNGQSRSTSSVSVFHGPELYLPGTQNLCPTPSAAPTPSPSPSASPSPTPTIAPSILPSILPTPGNGSPTPSPGGSAAPSG